MSLITRGRRTAVSGDEETGVDAGGVAWRYVGSDDLARRDTAEYAEGRNGREGLPESGGLSGEARRHVAWEIRLRSRSSFEKNEAMTTEWLAAERCSAKVVARKDTPKLCGMESLQDGESPGGMKCG
jgi:hypothetical protein